VRVDDLAVVEDDRLNRSARRRHAVRDEDDRALLRLALRWRRGSAAPSSSREIDRDVLVGRASAPCAVADDGYSAATPRSDHRCRAHRLAPLETPDTDEPIQRIRGMASAVSGGLEGREPMLLDTS